jgi:predicted dehydrogenase
MKKNIGLIGVGNRPLPKNLKNSNWDGWVKNLLNSKKIEIICACDPNPIQLKRIKNIKFLFKIKTYLSSKEMIKENKLDAVIICSPAKYHLNDILLCLYKNIKILVEKPCVVNMKEAKKVIQTRKSHLINVVQNWRYKDNSILIKDVIKKKTIGSIGQIFFRYLRNREKLNYSKYIYEEKFPALYAMGSHHIDLFRFILNDDIKSVEAFSYNPKWSKYKYDSSQIILLRTHNNTIINYNTTFSSKNESLPQESLVIEGESGYIYNESDWFEPPVYLYKKKKINLSEKKTKKLWDIKSQNNLSDMRITNNFIKFINNKKHDNTTFRDATKSIAVIEAIIKSIKLKK